MVTEDTVLKTLGYYAENATQFAATTQNVDFSETRGKFIKMLPDNAFILDFGCGAGRDTRAFIEEGIKVEAWDGSPELCSIASQYSGIKVQNKLFDELEEHDKYDGIWACASILHLPMPELKVVFEKIIDALKTGGVFYTSFKYGDYEGERNGRYFTDMTEVSFAKMVERYQNIAVIELWNTGDVRPKRKREKWLNVLLRKV